MASQSTAKIRRRVNLSPGALTSMGDSEAPVNERRLKRGEEHQQHDGQRNAQTDQCVLHDGFHRATPNISASIDTASFSGSMKGTQPRVTRKNVSTVPAARTGPVPNQGCSIQRRGVFTRITL